MDTDDSCIIFAKYDISDWLMTSSRIFCINIQITYYIKYEHQTVYKSSAVAENRRHAECALAYRHLWPRSIQLRAKTIVVCFRWCMAQFRNRCHEVGGHAIAAAWRQKAVHHSRLWSFLALRTLRCNIIAENETARILADVDDCVVWVRVVGTPGTSSSRLHWLHFKILRLFKQP